MLRSTSPYWKLTGGLSYAPHVLGAAKKKSSARREAFGQEDAARAVSDARFIHGIVV
jgi:hypothetical protein